MPETTTQGGGQPKLPMQGISQPTREEVLKLPRVHISGHPVMAHKVTALRDKNTGLPLGRGYRSNANPACGPWPG